MWFRVSGAAGSFSEQEPQHQPHGSQRPCTWQRALQPLMWGFHSNVSDVFHWAWTCRPVASSGVGARGVKIRELRRHPGMSLRHTSSTSGVGALVVDHRLREPSKAWLHHVHTESATRVRGNPGKETRGEGGGGFVASGAPALQEES